MRARRVSKNCILAESNDRDESMANSWSFFSSFWQSNRLGRREILSMADFTSRPRKRYDQLSVDVLLSNRPVGNIVLEAEIHSKLVFLHVAFCVREMVVNT